MTGSNGLFMRTVRLFTWSLMWLTRRMPLIVKAKASRMYTHVTANPYGIPWLWSHLPIVPHSVQKIWFSARGALQFGHLSEVAAGVSAGSSRPCGGVIGTDDGAYPGGSGVM